MNTYRLCLDELLLRSLVLFLEADIVVVEGEHALLDVLWNILPRKGSTKVTEAVSIDCRRNLQ